MMIIIISTMCVCSVYDMLICFIISFFTQQQQQQHNNIIEWSPEYLQVESKLRIIICLLCVCVISLCCGD